MWNDDDDDDDDDGDDEDGAVSVPIFFTETVSQIMFKFVFTQPCLIKSYGWRRKCRYFRSEARVNQAGGGLIGQTSESLQICRGVSSGGFPKNISTRFPCFPNIHRTNLNCQCFFDVSPFFISGYGGKLSIFQSLSKIEDHRVNRHMVGLLSNHGSWSSACGDKVEGVKVVGQGPLFGKTRGKHMGSSIGDFVLVMILLGRWF